MKILFITGNGFDMNLDLKTSFKQFNEYYLENPSKTNAVKKFKESISSNIEDWADLEIALGNYTQEMVNQEEFDLIFEDLVKELGIYMGNQEAIFKDQELVDAIAMINSLTFPENYLLPADKEIIKNFRNRWVNHPTSVRIATFNYTRIIEKFFEPEEVINKNEFDKDVIFNSVYHIHGLTDSRLVVGVNDVSQIANEKFRENIDITESIVKPMCNQALKYNVEVDVKQLIHEANLICIFGSSLGKTDAMWWNIIGNKLYNQDSKLLIFSKDSNLNETVEVRRSRIERKIKDLFLSRTAFSNEQADLIKNKIFVGVNTSLFKETEN